MYYVESIKLTYKIVVTNARLWRLGIPAAFMFSFFVALYSVWTREGNYTLYTLLILGAILTLAVTQPGTAFYLLLSYSLGLGLPFLLAGMFAAQFSGFLQKSQRFLKYFNIIGGIILIILGILVFTNSLSRFANFGLILKWL